MNVIEFNNQCQQWVEDIPELSGFVRVSSDSQAVTKLNDKKGMYLVAVLPTYMMSGDTPKVSENQNAIFWIIEKGDFSNKDEQELAQYARCEAAIQKLKNMLILAQEDGCSPFWRLEVSSIVIEPDFNAFGGWNGYFMSVTF